ncbi:acyl-CoA Delta(11) desaturase [Chelonus insularis]|uniref:acyl-CoA Delta(11) desaturase n=1 Tax=Chelonus insularis TaxID=460826 RepID=UPI00158B2C1C|nr:acyl-CoA Delta(11) desaturase [Chelonus insularis]XP_034944314.1 acyl-CoA Delta(11) desaturase [Chelonus insularis]
MAPNVTTALTNVLCEEELAKNQIPKPEFKRKIVWTNVVIFLGLHAGALYGVYLALTSAKILTLAYAYLLYLLSGFGITAGAHRLWSHRAYKAKLPLRIFLMLCNTLAFQNSIYEWSRDHRVHHKFSETDADPHNATRGFFFSHVGWLLCKKHPDVKQKGKGIDMSDLEADPVVAFQKKYYFILMPLLCFILPSIVPVYAWNESWLESYFVATLLRYVFTLNMTWLVNSAAHFFGGKPYDKYMNPAENTLVAVGALGEGWHNYHHVFPWDYKAAELGNYKRNFTTAFIDFFARIGWAYDLKTVSNDMVKHRVLRTGDGTHPVWGWGDKDQTIEERESAVITNHTKYQ